jgi:hypothetical protein
LYLLATGTLNRSCGGPAAEFISESRPLQKLQLHQEISDITQLGTSANLATGSLNRLWGEEVHKPDDVAWPTIQLRGLPVVRVASYPFYFILY